MADPMVEDEVMSEEEEEDDEEEDEEDHSLANPEAVTKYNTCAGIANKVLAHLVKQCKPGRKIVELCTEGDKLIKEEVSKIYNKKKTDKGVAFPTCISTNNCVGHYSPLSDDVAVLQEGDLVKIDLGCHVDGIIAVVGHTIVCQAADNAAPVTGRKADVICAAHLAKECALRLMRPGKKNTDVTEAIQKVAEAFHCQPVEGVLSHQMKRYVVDGNKVILNKALPEHKVDEFTFEENEVYGVDIVISTGEGKTKELESRTTVYKRAVETNYLLKMKASRYIYNEINAQYPTFPFTIRAFDEKRSRLGIVELLKHGLVHPYPVLYEKPGEFVAQFKFTVLILPSNISMITGHELPHVKSEYSITDPKLLAVLELGTKRTSQKKKNKKKGKKKAEGAAAAPAATPAAAPAPAASAPAAASMDTS